MREAYGFSTDLNRYIGAAPDDRVYDRSAWTYILGSKFTPLFLKRDAGCYLIQLCYVVDGILGWADAWIGQFRSSAPTPLRGVNAQTLRSVVAVFRRSEAIEPAARRPQNQQIVLFNAVELSTKASARSAEPRAGGLS
ncbi:hypothetical protein [Kaistia sp. MMO-174]|uniref:hypothetical protein n=1 Tax=Kaistia sp. MMO-174 TaxID=3081256 RepID=UPI003015F18C